MSITLIAGSYPQVDGKFSILDGSWDEDDLIVHGHTLVELRIGEITLKCEGSVRSYDELNDTQISSEMQAIADAMLGSTQRLSTQFKTTMKFDMTKISCREVERAIRAEIDFHRKRISSKVTIYVETMITHCNGYECHWGRVDKGPSEGIAMVLAYVNNKHVGRMSNKDRAATMAFTWTDTVCVVKDIFISKERKTIGCEFSSTELTQRR
jgi:hypothetical protein